MARGTTGKLQLLARELSAPERTLRRAVQVGAVRCRRPGPRRLEIDGREVDYLRGHWKLIADLRSALRTEPRVRTAVLFGSTARGDETEASDLDLLVELAEGSSSARLALEGRLLDRLDREVQVVSLEEAAANPPFLYTILLEGRVIVDRDRTWAELRRQLPAIRRAALKARAEKGEAARHAMGSLGNTRR